MGSARATGARSLVLALVLAACAVEDPDSGSEVDMPPPADLSSEELEYLEREARSWVRTLRERHRPHARQLTDDERKALTAFFPEEVLDRARVQIVARLENPPFYRIFDESERAYPVDFRRASAIALIDTVLVNGSRLRPDSPRWLTTLFHELVHHVQYRELGDSYYERYVRGWADQGGRYRSIPIEVQAFELAGRFRANPDQPFSVEDQVRRLAADLPEPR